MMRIRTVVSALLPILLCVVLLGTIYFTSFDWEWIAFLSGIFVAAVLALTSRASGAEWRVARRNRQIEKLKEKVSADATRCRAAEQSLADSDGRNRLLYDTSESLIVYVDSDQVCRYHNLAFASAVDDPNAQIVGRTLHDVLGDEAYSRLKIGLERNLSGKGGQSGHTLMLSRDRAVSHNVRFIPDCTPGGQFRGCWLLLSEALAGESRTRDFLNVADTMHGRARAMAGEDAADESTGELHYLQSMTEDLTGWADPKARFLEALEGDQFCLWYQAIRRCGREVTGPDYAEILIRLQEEENNMLPPGAFFPVAERYHLMASLDRWVVRKVLDWYQSKRKPGDFPRFCVNFQ